MSKLIRGKFLNLKKKSINNFAWKETLEFEKHNFICVKNFELGKNIKTDISSLSRKKPIYRHCHEKTSFVSNYGFSTLLHE